MAPRLQPIDPPYTDGVAEALRRLMGGADREPLALFRTVAHNPEILDRFRQIGSTLLSFGRLDPADRETVIHRTTARCGAAYEWGVHAELFARPLGLSDAWLEASWHGDADDTAFTDRQSLLVRACDELHDGGTLTDGTWLGLRSAFDDAQLVEVVCLAGFYHLVSFVCGAFAIEPEPWAARP